MALVGRLEKEILVTTGFLNVKIVVVNIKLILFNE